MTTSAIPLEELISLRYPAPEWAVVFELSNSVGASSYWRRADAAAFNCWPSTGQHRLAFEVKRTRSDYMREIDTPNKRKWLEENFHQCYFVVVPGIVKPDEIPDGWGLLVSSSKGDKLIRRKVARHRDLSALPESLALSAIRALSTTMHSERFKHYIFDGKEVSQDDIDGRVTLAIADSEKSLQSEWEKVRKVRQVLEDREKLLEAPLKLLAHEAGEYSAFRTWREKPLEVTSEDVRRWMNVVRKEALLSVMKKVILARDSLSDLILASSELGYTVEKGLSRKK